MTIDKVKFQILKQFPESSVPEHQVLLSFDNDIGAELFEEWFSVEGEQMFFNFVQDYK